MRFISFVLTVALGTTIVAAQKPPGARVTLDVRVFGADDTAVSNLTKDDFTVYEGVQRQEIQSFESAEVPCSILLLVERSGSMENDWVFLEPAINRFLSALRPQDRVAIAGFVDKPEVLVDWRSARGGQFVDVDLRPYRRQLSYSSTVIKPAQNGQSEMRASYSSRPVTTDFYGALLWAEGKMQGVRTRKGVIVFSGGIQPLPPVKRTGGRIHVMNSADDMEFQKILRSTEQAEVPIYFVTVGTDLNPRHAFPINNVVNPMQIRSRLEQLGEASGGSVAYPRKLDDVAAIYEQIARELGTTYTLTIASSRTTGNLSNSKIEVKVRGDNLRVRQSIHEFPSIKTTGE